MEGPPTGQQEAASCDLVAVTVPVFNLRAVGWAGREQMSRTPNTDSDSECSPGFWRLSPQSQSLAILLPLENNPFKTSELSRLVIWPLIPESPERAAAGLLR